MAENTLGRNIEFPIYYDVNGTKTPFHDIILRKSVYESSVMGLDDKITGDFYYPNNTLAFSMQEYIEYENVKYYIINPPTIIREGQVADNSELKGMTKYSVTFYHPMCQLSNMEFTDVAVSNDERQYKSQDKIFYWIGHITDFIAKLNKNLEGTEWVVVQGSSLEGSDKLNELSDVLSFSNEYISDALKRAYDTWGVPFIIVSLHSGEYYDINHIDYYSQEGGSKRFVVIFGLPDNGVYQVDANNSYTLVNGEKQPFIFRLGQGLGLKNNSRTPKNNKIVTRISGYGSERNIPYGYPQIVWHGDPNATCTLGDSIGIKPSITINGHTFTNVMSYPIYEGIVGGQWVKLIKHPFTRTHLMPSIYYETVFNKVSPYLPKNGNTLVYNNNFNPDGTIIDYYDAINDSDYTYIHQINPAAPSTHINEFDEYPRLNSATLPADAIPYQDNPDDSLIGGKGYITYDYFTQVTEEYLSTYNNQTFESALEELLDAMSESQTYGQNEVKGEGYEYYWSYRYETYLIEVEFGFQNEIGITPKNFEFSYKVVRPDVTFPSEWDDTMEEDGTLAQSYFQLTLPRLSFDIYACAAITEKMQINMRSGACIGCTFDIQCDWERYKYAFYDEDGNFAPLGERRMGMLDEFPRSDQGSIKVIAAKDINTFGTPLPSIYQQPKQGDEFVVLGISLPLSYITEAEERLDVKMKDYMLENNIYYYDYPFKFDEFFLATHTGILSQIHNNSRIEFQFGNELVDLYVNKISIKFGDKVLPQYDISFTDNIEVVMSKIGETVNAEVRHTLISNGYDVVNQGSSSTTNVTISQSKGNSRDMVMSQAAVTNELDSLSTDMEKYEEVVNGRIIENALQKRTFKFIINPNHNIYRLDVTKGEDSFSRTFEDIHSVEELDYVIQSDVFYTLQENYGLVETDYDDADNSIMLVFETVSSPSDIASVTLTDCDDPQAVDRESPCVVPTGYPLDTTGKEFVMGTRWGYVYPPDHKHDQEIIYKDYNTNTLWAWNGSEYVPLGTNIEVDDEPTEGSENAVSSGGTWRALQGKVDKVATSTTNAVVKFADANGTLKNSGVTINDNNHVTAAKFITSGGTSSKFVKGDGSLDSKSYIPYDSVLMNTNPFGGKRLYVNSVDNAFASADKKFYVTVTLHYREKDGVTYPYINSEKTIIDDDYFVDGPIYNTYSSARNIFDGCYETLLSCTTGYYMKVRIMFGSNTSPSATTSYFTGYPYGSYYLSYYYSGTPDRASQCRIYDKYSTEKGWRLKEFFTYSGSINSNAFVEYVVESGLYQRSCVEFIIYGKRTGNYDTSLTQIDYSLARPNLGRDGSTVTKYDKQSLYHDFAWYNNHVKTVSIGANGNISATSFIKSGGTSSQFLKADGSVDSNIYLTSGSVKTINGESLIGSGNIVLATESYANTAHHISIHPQDNVEIAGTVRRYWELYLSNISTLGLPQTFTPTEMGYIGFTSDVISGILSRRYLRISEMYDEEQPIEFPNYKRTYEVVDVRMKLANNEEDYYMYFSLRYEGKYYWDFVGFDDEGEITWTLTTHMLTSPVDSELSSTSTNPVQNSTIYQHLLYKASSSSVETLEGYFEDGKAKQAEHADTATLAANATNASHAQTATSAAEAESAGTATVAQKAYKDGNDNTITTTYVKHTDVGIGGTTVFIDENSVDVRDVYLGYYCNGYTLIITWSAINSTMTGTFSFYDRSNYMTYSIDCSGSEFLGQIADIFAQLGYDAVIDSQNNGVTIETENNTGLNAFNWNGYGSTVSTQYISGNGFYGSFNGSVYYDQYDGLVGRLYIDVNSNILYRYNGNEYVPMRSSPFTSAYYDNQQDAIIFTYPGGSIVIPLQGIIPTYIGGKGITVSGNTIEQNYLVISETQLADYLEHGNDDNIIRYVYEDE